MVRQIPTVDFPRAGAADFFQRKREARIVRSLPFFWFEKFFSLVGAEIVCRVNLQKVFPHVLTKEVKHILDLFDHEHTPMMNGLNPYVIDPESLTSSVKDVKPKTEFASVGEDIVGRLIDP